MTLRSPTSVSSIDEPVNSQLLPGSSGSQDAAEGATGSHLYRISTDANSNGGNRLFLFAFPPYPEIIEHSIWVSSN